MRGQGSVRFHRRGRRLHLFQSANRARVFHRGGLTGNFKNTSTQYTNGVDLHVDWGASQFLSKQNFVGLVGYAYKQISCDSGSGDRVGCFQSQVVGIGPQIGFLFPVGNISGKAGLRDVESGCLLLSRNVNQRSRWTAWWCSSSFCASQKAEQKRRCSHSFHVHRLRKRTPSGNLPPH